MRDAGRRWREFGQFHAGFEEYYYETILVFVKEICDARHARGERIVNVLGVDGVSKGAR